MPSCTGCVRQDAYSAPAWKRKRRLPPAWLRVPPPRAQHPYSSSGAAADLVRPGVDPEPVLGTGGERIRTRSGGGYCGVALGRASGLRCHGHRLQHADRAEGPATERRGRCSPRHRPGLRETRGATLCKPAAATALEYAKLNTNSGMADAPAPTFPEAGTVEVTTAAKDAKGAGMTLFLANVFGVSRADVVTNSKAKWGGPSALTTALPVAFSECRNAGHRRRGAANNTLTVNQRELGSSVRDRQ
jgi:hypothetical protein